jgi:hypothetical protein
VRGRARVRGRAPVRVRVEAVRQGMHAMSASAAAAIGCRRLAAAGTDNLLRGALCSRATHGKHDGGAGVGPVSPAQPSKSECGGVQGRVGVVWGERGPLPQAPSPPAQGWPRLRARLHARPRPRPRPPSGPSASHQRQPTHLAADAHALVRLQVAKALAKHLLRRRLQLLVLVPGILSGWGGAGAARTVWRAMELLADHGTAWQIAAGACRGCMVMCSGPPASWLAWHRQRRRRRAPKGWRAPCWPAGQNHAVACLLPILHAEHGSPRA